MGGSQGRVQFRRRQAVIRRHIQLEERLLCDSLENRGGNFSSIDSSLGFINLNQDCDSWLGKGSETDKRRHVFRVGVAPVDNLLGRPGLARRPISFQGGTASRAS